jgi:glutamyl-Q tRNA(Asp) synthetase
VYQTNYVGRFAPSPTGPLHYGSLLAATASYLQAKKNKGQWLVRIEDIDPAREVKGAAVDILSTLEQYQFEWDDEPLYQSSQFSLYRKSVESLIQKGKIYACSCTRKDLSENFQKSSLGKYYPGTCSNKQLDPANQHYSLRLRVHNQEFQFHDGVFGLQTNNLYKQIGDVVIYRKYNLPSYSLAVTVDDAVQNVTEVVRGYDLLEFTPLQIYLCELLQLPKPNFVHIPVVVNDQGQKLSKQTYAQTLPKKGRRKILIQAFKDLGQQVPRALESEPLDIIWECAIQNWDVSRIPKVKSLKYSL